MDHRGQITGQGKHYQRPFLGDNGHWRRIQPETLPAAVMERF